MAGENLKVRRVGGGRMTQTPDQELRTALKTYAKRVQKPTSLAVDAHRAVRKAMGLPEDPAT